MMKRENVERLVLSTVEGIASEPRGSLRAMSEARLVVKHAETLVAAAVAEARDEGRSWGQIGAQLGMSRQGAHEKWSQVVEHRASRVRPAGGRCS